MKKIFSLVLFFSLLAGPAYAAEFMLSHERNDRNVSISAQESHKNLYAAGASVNVNGNTLGDLFAAGGMVTVNGNVEKDLFVAGGNLNLNGTVGDDLRVAGGSISINGTVGTDLLATGGNITIAQKATVNGDLVLTGGNLLIDSEVKGKANITGGEVTINGKIIGDVTVTAQELTFGQTSEVVGKIIYKGSSPAVVREGAKIGVIEFTKMPSRQSGRDAFKALFAIATLVKLIGLLIVGFVLLYLIPQKVTSALSYANSNTLKNLGIGVLAAVLWPIISVLLFITIIGFYLSLIMFLMYMLMLLLASVLVLFYTGNLAYKLYKKDALTSLRRDLVLGTIIVLVLSFIPIVGWLAITIGLLIVLGGLLTDFWKNSIKQV